MILQENEILLLVDDIDFSIQNEESIISISSFLDSFPKTRLIGTSLDKKSLSQGGVSLPSFPFQRVEISSFDSKRINYLIDKWTSNEKIKNVEEKIDYIVEAFSTFRLPSTPFAISMLLWIIEKGSENYPSNMALLMEQFMNITLDFCKTGKRKKGALDRENKNRLLGRFAYEMLQRRMKESKSFGTPFTEGDSIKVIECYLYENGWQGTYKPQDILDGLLSVGILELTGANDVQFRFKCFEEYFLSKQMTYDSNLYNTLTLEQNYLHFCNEIFYYTGIHKDKNSLLQTIFDRLEYRFIDLVEDLGKYRIDDYFVSNKGLLESLPVSLFSEAATQKRTQKEYYEEKDFILHNQYTETKDKKERVPEIENILQNGDLLLLAMRVLRNTEEVFEAGITDTSKKSCRSKSQCLEDVIDRSVYYAILCYLQCLWTLSTGGTELPTDQKERIGMFMFLLPVLHEELLRSYLNTPKLSNQIREVLDKKTQVAEESEFMKFILVFLYADQKGANYFEYLESFIKSIKKSFIIDACYFKINRYYYESHDMPKDERFLNLMADLYIKSHTGKGVGRINKTALMQRLKQNKDRQGLFRKEKEV